VGSHLILWKSSRGDHGKERSRLTPFHHGEQQRQGLRLDGTSQLDPRDPGDIAGCGCQLAFASLRGGECRERERRVDTECTSS